MSLFKIFHKHFLFFLTNQPVTFLDLLLSLFLYLILIEVHLLAVFGAQVVVYLEQRVHDLLMRLKQCRLQQIRQLDVFSHDVAWHLENVLKGIDALQKYMAIVNNEFETFASGDFKFSLVFPSKSFT